MIEWLDEFYGDPDLKATMLRNFLPLFSSYVAEATGGPVAANFVQALAESYVDRHLGSSRAQLQEVIKGADDPLADLQRRFDEWEEKRPGKVAANELVRSANAASVEKMREAGVTKMVWRASGAKTCPFCTELEGTVVSVDGTFFNEGESLSPEGATAPIHFESSLGHPPIHQGCVCSVEAVTTVDASPEVQEQAAQLIEEVTGSEPTVTDTLRRIGRETDGELRGLQHKLKTESSTARKMAADLRDNPSWSPQEARGRIYDALRYTYEFEPANYANGVRDSIQRLESEGYSRLRVKDFWNKGNGYTGVQGVWQSPNGSFFELQFHTPATLAAKDPSHVLFEEQRLLPKSHSRWDSLQEQMDTLWGPIRADPPPGVADLDFSP